jgi:hypothetical protein
VEPSVQFLINKGVLIDDVKYFDKLCPKKFTESYFSNEKVTSLPAHQKRTRYFENKKNCECHSEFLKILQFFAITAYSAKHRGSLSLMQVQWTMGRNMLTVESLRRLLCI